MRYYWSVLIDRNNDAGHHKSTILADIDFYWSVFHMHKIDFIYDHTMENHHPQCWRKDTTIYNSAIPCYVDETGETTCTMCFSELEYRAYHHQSYTCVLCESCIKTEFGLVKCPGIDILRSDEQGNEVIKYQECNYYFQPHFTPQLKIKKAVLNQ